MDFSKLKNKLLIVLCVLIVFLPFYLITPVLADSEELTPITASNLKISPNSNVFESINSGSVSYIEMEVGYIYYISFDSQSVTSDRYVAVSSDIPAANGVYTYLGSLSLGDTFTYRPTQDSYFLCSYPTNSNAVTFTREKITSMDGVVGDLVDNVGIQSLWNTFNDANPFILVVVLFSFGLFIIIALVRKLRKGKGGI